MIKVTGPVVTIGDLHGNIIEASQLWERILLYFNNDISEVTFVFLGDYCDRGPDTSAVIEWLITLKKSLKERIHFIVGNHDFGMLSFLGLLEFPAGTEIPANGLERRHPRFTTGFWPHAVEDELGIHYQGRRWGHTRSVYNSRSTLHSYDVEVPPFRNSKLSLEEQEISMRHQFISNVPDHHKAFLKTLDYVIEITQECETKMSDRADKTRKIICVHAGFSPDRPLESQIAALRNRDFFNEAIIEDVHSDPSRVLAFCTRGDVAGLHPDAPEGTVIVSGHHHRVVLSRSRVIIDSSGGRPGNIIKAVVLDGNDEYSLI